MLCTKRYISNRHSSRLAIYVRVSISARFRSLKKGSSSFFGMARLDASRNPFGAHSLTEVFPTIEISSELQSSNLVGGQSSLLIQSIDVGALIADQLLGCLLRLGQDGVRYGFAHTHQAPMVITVPAPASEGVDDVGLLFHRSKYATRSSDRSYCQ